MQLPHFASANHTAPPSTDGPPVEVCGFSYEDRSAILPVLADALSGCGCWLQDRKALTFTRMEYSFEVPLRLAFDLYSALIASGLELTRSSHRELTGLCTLRKFNPRPQELGRVIPVRLEVHFLEEAMEPPVRTAGFA